MRSVGVALQWRVAYTAVNLCHATGALHAHMEGYHVATA